MEHLVVRLQEEAAPAQWAVFDENGRVVSHAQGGSLAEAAEAAAGRRVIALVSGIEVVLTEASLPKASPTRLRKMLPFALEDTFAEDVEDLFFAVGRRLDSATVAVAVVSDERLGAWLTRLRDAGVAAHAVYADSEGVPDTPATLSLVIENERVYGRAPGRPPFVFEGLPLEQIAAVADPERSLDHAVVYVDEAGRGRHAEGLHELAERIESTQVKLMGDGAFYRLAATLVAEPGINLLQGVHAPKSNIGVLLKPWRAAAALAAALVLGSVAVQAAEYVSLQMRDRALTERLAETCRQALSVELNACERAARTRLSQSGMGDTGPGFLVALSTVADARAANTRILSLDYRRGEMTLQLLVRDNTALDAFAREVDRSDLFDASIVFANSPTESGVEGQIRLQSGSSR